MFGNRYFGPRFFGDRFFGEGIADTNPNPAPLPSEFPPRAWLNRRFPLRMRLRRFRALFLSE